MKSNYSFFRYLPGDSKFHIMNSKMKIIWFLLSVLISLIILDYLSLLIFSLVLMFILIKTEIKPGVYLSNVLILWPLYVLVALICFLITLNFSFSLLIILKLIIIITLFLILTFTTSLSEIAWGFECLFNPLKRFGVPVSKMSLGISLSIKFISTLFEQFGQVRKSMAYRGIPYGKNKFTSFRKMLIPLIRLSYKLSIRMISAMKLRFYGYCKRRTNYHENKVTGFDKIIVATDVILLYVIIWLGWM